MPTLAWKGLRAYAVHYSTVEGKPKPKWIPLGKFQRKSDGKIAYYDHLQHYGNKKNKIVIFKDFVSRATEWSESFKSPTTLAAEKKHLAVLQKEFNHLRLESITGDLLLRWMAKHGTWKKTTMRNRLGLLKQILDLASEMGYRIADPYPFKIAKIPRPQIYEFDPKTVEAGKVLEVFDKLQVKYRKIAMILYYSGIRPAELWRMGPENILGSEFSLPPELTKTRRGRRVPISKKIVDCLDAIPVSLTRQAFARAIKVASAGAVTPYTLRHQFASDLLNVGVDIRKVQQLLGHSRLEMTARYAWATNKTLEESVDLL